MATTLEKIKQIEREQYNDFDGRKMIGLKQVHSILRNRIGDEDYLRYIEKQQKENPRPVHKNTLQEAKK